MRDNDKIINMEIFCCCYPGLQRGLLFGVFFLAGFYHPIEGKKCQGSKMYLPEHS